MSEHPFDGLYAAVEETQFAPGIVVGEVLAQITFGAGGGNPLDDFRTLGIDELAHFGDERGLAVCGEQEWSNECHLIVSGTGGATQGRFGADGEIRTPGQWFTKPLLYH